jgi:23S rRNA (adenine2503-C2)-methyltransferase
MNLNHWNNVRRFDSTETDVCKFVFTAPDAVVETVLYKYPDYQTRTVICCSTMSGCPVGCTFCGTGKFFIRNLTGDQIVEQVEYALEQTGVDPNTMERLQIMVMSMGEPLLNKKGLIESFRTLYKRYPRAALLISTSGPAINYEWVRKLSNEIPTIGLQFSVHESTNEARDKLVPFKRKLTLEQIAYEGERWERWVGRKPFFNYCTHKDNSSDDDADRLRDIFDPRVWEATISVICEKDPMLGRDEEAHTIATTFSEKLLMRGYNTRVFDPAGQDDIGGGCGQLWFVQDWAKQNPEHVRKSIGARI